MIREVQKSSYKKTLVVTHPESKYKLNIVKEEFADL